VLAFVGRKSVSKLWFITSVWCATHALYEATYYRAITSCGLPCSNCISYF